MSRPVHLHEIDCMLEQLWPDACAGTVSAVNRVAKLIDLRAKLFGLPERRNDAATQGPSV